MTEWPLLLVGLVLGVACFLSGWLVGFAFAQPKPDVVKAMALLYDLVHYVWLDPEAQDYVERWKALVGRN